MTKKEKLKHAANHAKYPHFYEQNFEPSCVIGQLAFLEGVPIETLQDWDKAGGYLGDFYEEVPEFAQYEKALLVKLQRYFDARQWKKMLKLVEDYHG